VRGVAVEITKWMDDQQPGFVECQLTDADGRIWRFIEKVPVITAATLGRSTSYPQPGVIACEVLSDRLDAKGRKLVEVDTARPWGVESTDGRTRFTVLATSVVQLKDAA
jgi:hypothetical protein